MSPSERSHRHNAKGWIESLKIIRIGRDRLLADSASADHDMGIHNVGRPAGSKQPPDVGGVNPVQRNDVGGRLAKEPGQTHLTFRLADSLRESGRGNGDAGSGLPGAGQQHDHSAVVPVERDQRAGSESYRDSAGQGSVADADVACWVTRR